MEIAPAYNGDMGDVAGQQLALVSGPASAGTSDPQLTGGIAVSAAPSSSPSQERLVRIAAMIRDAELAMPVSDRRKRLRPGAGVIPLTARRLRRAAVRPRAGVPEAAPPGDRDGCTATAVLAVQGVDSGFVNLAS